MGLLDLFKPKSLDPSDPRLLAALVVEKCNKYELDPVIMSALIWQESKGDIWATRYEKGFFKRYLEGKGRRELSGFVPPDSICSLSTELSLRSHSLGSCQLMGETLRWQGFKGNYLVSACMPGINLEYGCKYLRYCYDKKKHETPGRTQTKAALALYNGIRNHVDSEYDEKVIGHVESGAYKNILYP